MWFLLELPTRRRWLTRETTRGPMALPPPVSLEDGRGGGDGDEDDCGRDGLEIFSKLKYNTVWSSRLVDMRRVSN